MLISIHIEKPFIVKIHCKNADKIYIDDLDYIQI